MNDDILTSTPRPTASAPTTAEEKVQALQAQVRQLEVAARTATDLFEQLPSAGCLLTADGQIVNVNHRGLELLGRPLSVLVRRRMTSLLAPTAQGTLSALLERVRKTGVRQSAQLPLVLPSGETLELLLDAAPYAGESAHGREGTEGGYLLALMDVTAFGSAHRTLLDSAQAQQHELQATQLKLRQLNEEFEQVMSLSRQHLSERLTRAHNFLNRSLRGGTLWEADLKHAADSLTQTLNLLASLDRYMHLRSLRTRTRRIELEQVWREALVENRQALGSREVQVTAAPLPAVHGDSQVLRLILSEYLTNALKFSRPRERTVLRLLVQEADTEYRIGLEDNGIGFNMRHKDKVFTLFGRLHPSSEYEGTGIGLVVVRRLCERFGGRAWGEGKEGHGATFWFAWPKVPASAPGPALGPTLGSGSGSGGGSGSGSGGGSRP